MPTIEELVLGAGASVADDELVNFGHVARTRIAPSTSRCSYWFRFADIKRMPLLELQVLAVGQMASAGQPGGADFMRVCAVATSHFTRRAGTNVAGIEEYTIDIPVAVFMSIRVGT